MSNEVPQGIQSIPKSDIHRITSGQVVLDIQGAVKELIENALDAGAKAIGEQISNANITQSLCLCKVADGEEHFTEVRFKEYGADLIEVIDNGCGIGPENYKNLALKHHTSKLTSFQDLTNVRTFGFRGEALSSLCELCTVQVVTAIREEEPIGTVLELNRDGTIKSQDKKVARQRGTTVTLVDLFVTLPVRRKELLKNIKREFAKAQALLQAYAIISKGVRWVVSNTVKGRRSNIMTITGSDNLNYLMNNVSAVFGAKSSTALTSLDLEIPIEKARITSKSNKVAANVTVDTEMEDETILVQGLISRPTHGSGRASSDRVFLYLNGRPWDSHRILRAFNEIYKSFNSNQVPMIVANFTIQGERYDVNVSPDKRTLFLHDETELIEGLKTALEDQLSPFQSTFTVNGANLSAAKDAAIQSQLPYQKTRTENNSSSSSQLATQLRNNMARKSSSQQEDDQNNDDEEEDENANDIIRSLKRRKLQDDEAEQSRPLSRATSQEEDERSSTLDSRESSTFEDPFSRDVDVKGGKSDESGLLHEPPINLVGKNQGRNASPATIEAKLSGSTSPVKIWNEKLRSYAAHGTITKYTIAPERGVITEDVDVTEKFQDLEYREEGLSIQQANEAMHRLEEYRGEMRQEIESASEESKRADQEREENLLLLEGEAKKLSETSVSAEIWKGEMVDHVEKIGGVSAVVLNLSKLRLRLQERMHKANSMIGSQASSIEDLFDHAGLQESDIEAVEVTLSRSIDKSDFAMMEIIGQFNLGFIISRRRNESGEDDLFIIDQHAADEKFNFESLQRETILRSQNLIRPRLLELPSSVEMIAAQHIDSLAAHGFIVKVNEEAMPGSRVALHALPISKNTTFGVADLEELLHRLEDVTPDSARARSIRCSKLYNMLASRACRKSVMIGRALTARQMKVILQHMGEIEQPWNCPHGRPTIRHLHRLDLYSDQLLERNKDDTINWQSLMQ